MPKANFEENIREVIGSYVVQLIQAQTQVNQLSEQLAAAQEELQKIKALQEGLKLVPKDNGLQQHNPGDPPNQD